MIDIGNELLLFLPLFSYLVYTFRGGFRIIACAMTLVVISLLLFSSSLLSYLNLFEDSSSRMVYVVVPGVMFLFSLINTNLRKVEEFRNLNLLMALFVAMNIFYHNLSLDTYVYFTFFVQLIEQLILSERVKSSFSLERVLMMFFGKILLITSLFFFKIGSGSVVIFNSPIIDDSFYSFGLIFFTVSGLVDLEIIPRTRTTIREILTVECNEAMPVLGFTRFLVFISFMDVFQKLIVEAPLVFQRVLLTFLFVWISFYLIWLSIASVRQKSIQEFFSIVLQYSIGTAFCATFLNDENHYKVWYSYYFVSCFILAYYSFNSYLKYSRVKIFRHLRVISVLALIGCPFLGIFDLKVAFMDGLLNDGYILEVLVIYLTTFVLIYSYLSRKRNIPHMGYIDAHDKLNLGHKVFFQLGLLVFIGLVVSLYRFSFGALV